MSRESRNAASAKPDRPPRLYTVAEIARHTQCSERTVRRWLNAGLLPFHRLGRQIRIAAPDLIAFLRLRRQG
jgi:excisionase family DNA binding protein